MSAASTNYLLGESLCHSCSASLQRWGRGRLALARRNPLFQCFYVRGPCEWARARHRVYAHSQLSYRAPGHWPFLPSSQGHWGSGPTIVWAGAERGAGGRGAVSWDYRNRYERWADIWPLTCSDWASNVLVSLQPIRSWRGRLMRDQWTRRVTGSTCCRPARVSSV